MSHAFPRTVQASLGAGNYHIKDLVDIERLKMLFESFSKATGFTTGFVSNPDLEMLITTGWRDVCTKFHRFCPGSALHCKESNLALTACLRNLKELNIRHCGNGLVDGATPVIIRGKHLASLATGQVLFEPPDFGFFKAHAEKLGYNTEEYLAAVAQVPVVTEQQLKDALSFLSGLAVTIAEEGLNNLRLQESSDAQRESEMRFRLLAENSTDLICRFSPGGTCLYASPSCRILLGYEPEELVGTLVFDFFHPEEVDDHRIFHTRLLEGAEPMTVSSRVQRKDGAYAWFETSSRSIRDPQTGAVLEIQTSSRDVTQRKGIELALKKSDANMRTLVGNLPDRAIYQCLRKKDGSERYSFLSKKTGEIPAFQPLDGPAPLGATMHPDDLPRIQAAKDESARTLRILDFDGRILTQEGALKWMHWRSTPRRQDNGAIRWEGVMTDITKRKLAEDALHRAHRALIALKKCNEALLRATSETELLNTICKIIVENHGAQMAWVGFAENDAGKSVRAVASAGGDEYTSKARITWADTIRGRGPTGTAIRTHEVNVCHDLANNPGLKPWIKQQLKRGFTSMVALPLLWESRCMGALMIYSSEADSFNSEEVELLQQLAGDLTYGIVALRTRGERAALEMELLEISEREKQLIAQELHDGLCQHLAGTALVGSVLQRRLAARKDPETEAAKEICDLLNIGVREARNLSHGLHPVKPEPQGLMDALSVLAQTITKLFHVPCSFRCRIPVLIANQTAANHLFRIAQEALNNAIKHGQASEVRIVLKCASKGIALSIRDNGIGIPRDLPPARGMGIQIMNHRASVIGASLSIHRAGRRGTLVSCIMPIRAN